jgi:hypothetical protein
MITIETATVFNACTRGRRFLTLAGAVDAEARMLLQNKHPAIKYDHETGDPGFHWTELKRSDVLLRRVRRLVMRHHAVATVNAPADVFRKLVLEHSDAMAERLRLTKAGAAASRLCTRAVAAEDWSDTCISAAYAAHPQAIKDAGEYCSFDDVFMGMDPSPCEHCVLVRRLKRERGAIGRKLASIRSGMAAAANAERRKVAAVKGL